jgi:hypothetical protein
MLPARGYDMSSKPEVFIIESLKLSDEKKKRFEGKILADMLSLSDKKCIYYYIRTKKEFVEILDVFYRTDYRYLHISCHANKKVMGTTFDDIPFSELGDILKDIGEDRRIFLSACSMANQSLANEIIPKSQCYSILGPATEIDFDDAAIFWTSFYHLMFKHNPKAMKREIVLSNAEKIAKNLGIKLNYFGRKANNKGAAITRLPRKETGVKS